MAKIIPFKAVIYNADKVKDLSSAVCPPYDVIPAERQEYLHEINPYNFIHILLGRDIAGEDKYERAGGYFNAWLKNKILVQEENPAIYFYIQEYKVKGEKRIRYGFICLLQLTDKNSAVYAHEHTRLGPKEDRLRLLKQVKANLSPIFVVFADNKRIIQRTYQKYIQAAKPFIDITDDEKTTHKLWRLDSCEVISFIKDGLLKENIFIADGHHRYEVACAYRDLMKEKLGKITGEEDFNYILAYFTNTDSRGLSIFPIHRLLKLDSRISLDGFKVKLKEYFDIEEIKEKIKFFFLLEKAGRSEHILGMYKEKKYFFLRLKNIKILDRLISDKPKEYRLLDVSILNQIVFKDILKIDLENKDILTFSPDAGELIKEVDKDASYTAFFLNPVTIQQIMAVALKGERMPSKSTYFYPKVLSGLVVNKHEN